MKLATAITVLEKDAKFLGMNFADFLVFVKDHPLAQTKKTMEAYKVILNETTLA
jgi:hypothetical protein